MSSRRVAEQTSAPQTRVTKEFCLRRKRPAVLGTSEVEKGIIDPICGIFVCVRNGKRSRRAAGFTSAAGGEREASAARVGEAVERGRDLPEPCHEPRARPPPR